jgi:hypothetical protein
MVNTSAHDKNLTARRASKGDVVPFPVFVKPRVVNGSLWHDGILNPRSTIHHAKNESAKAPHSKRIAVTNQSVPFPNRQST